MNRNLGAFNCRRLFFCKLILLIVAGLLYHQFTFPQVTQPADSTLKRLGDLDKKVESIKVKIEMLDHRLYKIEALSKGLNSPPPNHCKKQR